MTPTDLRLATLRKLKVIGSGDEANADDIALMVEKYIGLHAMLLELQLVIWAFAEDIPVKCEQPVIMALAALAADDFGVPEPRATLLKSEGMLKLPAASLAERQLRALLAPAHVQSQVRSSYY